MRIKDRFVSAAKRILAQIQFDCDFTFYRRAVVNLEVRGSNPNSKVGSVFGAQVRGYPYGRRRSGSEYRVWK